MGVAMGRKLQAVARPAVVAAIVVGTAFAFSVFLLVQALTVLGTWPSVYAGRGGFTVDSCAVVPSRFAQHLRCRGHVVPDDDPRPITSVLLGPRAAFGTEIPSEADVVVAYYRTGDTSRSFPIDGRTTELIRAIVGVIPLVFLVGGTATWLVGWLLTRNIPRDEGERMPDRHVFPQRFALRPNGATWALVGALWWIGDRWLVDDLLGTAGLG